MAIERPDCERPRFFRSTGPHQLEAFSFSKRLKALSPSMDNSGKLDDGAAPNREARDTQFTDTKP